MKKLTILFITKPMQHHIERSTYYLGKELEKFSNLTYHHVDGNLPDIIRQMSIKPDFILFNDLKPDYCPWMRNVDQVKIPKGTLVHDLHYRIPRRKRMYQKDQIPHLFVQYREAFCKWFPEFVDQMIWLPHHVPAEIYRDYSFEKDIDILMMGSLIPHLYPLRLRMFQKLKLHPGFKYFDHPGYKGIPADNRYVTGPRYAQTMNRAKIFLTCDSIYKFPVLKYYEALACRTLLLASGSAELKDLGFIDKETYVEVNETDFYEKIMFYLKNESERNRIALNGMKLVQQKHTTQIRAKELLAHIQQIVKR
ncbi:glycosyltransferase family protein [Pseudalkalibacillus sp. SCS-8]|uniref:glycosyltransferase family protein n=1 Tax=Pseudalkalibacillus nanhaiensis TaxID=3115291 RepID=UPI0032DB6900